MKPKAVTKYRKLSELHELPGNPRTIKKDQFEKLKKSINDNADYFEARPIILSNRTGKLVIIAGNQRYKAAKAIGMTEVPTILLEGLSEEREREIVIRENKPSKSEEHPTMKPVKLIARLVANSSREGEAVLDIFGGSGTTMIACEQLGRSCYMMELDPHYADVIIERWQNFTGQTAKLIKEAD